MHDQVTPDDQQLHLKLELEANPDTIRGSIRDREGTRHRFWGWLELMSAVERLSSNDRYSDHPEVVTDREVSDGAG